VNKSRLLALVVTPIFGLFNCTSTAPTSTVVVAPPAPTDNKVAAAPAQQQLVKPQHECVGNNELSQYYVVERAR